jgi:hypothetical protein
MNFLDEAKQTMADLTCALEINIPLGNCADIINMVLDSCFSRVDNENPCGVVLLERASIRWPINGHSKYYNWLPSKHPV